MEKTKKSIFSKIFVCLSLCLVLLGALAPCFSMTKNESLRADSVSSNYSFIGSDLITVSSSVYYDNNANVLYWGFASVKFNIFSNSDGLSFEIGGDCLYRTDYYAFGAFSSFHVANIPVTSNEFTTRSYLLDYSNYYLNVLVRCSDYTKFIANINSVRFYSTEEIYPNFAAFNTFIRYYDINENWLEFSLRTVVNKNIEDTIPVIRKFLYDDRTYYFSNAFETLDGYETGFDAGYSDGYNKGSSDGNKTGYDSGYKAGNTLGYNKGYNDGLNEGSQYTFFNLIGATIDAPIKYFQSLFNFELLGINLSSFLMGLFTLCVVVTIVKLCLGR